MKQKRLVNNLTGKERCATKKGISHVPQVTTMRGEKE
jgi:hypothetical protein